MRTELLYLYFDCFSTLIQYDIRVWICSRPFYSVYIFTVSQLVMSTWFPFKCNEVSIQTEIWSKGEAHTIRASYALHCEIDFDENIVQPEYALFILVADTVMS